MIHDLITSRVSAAREGYISYLNSLNGAYSMAVSNYDPTTPIVKNEFRRTTGHLVETTQISLNQIIIQASVDVIRSAADYIASLNARDIDMSRQKAREIVRLELREAMLSLEQETIEQVHQQIVRDLSLTKTLLRNFQLEAKMRSVSRGVSIQSATIAVRARQSKFRTNFLDRGGKRWQSERYVEVTLHAFLYRLYNEAILYLLSKEGATFAKLSYPDESHKLNGMPFAIVSEVTKYPSYYEIRDEIFHPNSKAIVVANVVMTDV